MPPGVDSRTRRKSATIKGVSQFLLVIAVALTVGAIVFGIIVLMTGDDRGLSKVEPDGRAVPLPADRPLVEADVNAVRFDTGVRGYRMAQVDVALGRLAYDIGYKDELIKVLQSEVDALREGRLPDAEVLRRAREAAAAPAQYAPPTAGTGAPEGAVIELEAAEAPQPEVAGPEVAEAEVAGAEVAGIGESRGAGAEAGTGVAEVAEPGLVEAGPEVPEVETGATPGPSR